MNRPHDITTTLRSLDAADSNVDSSSARAVAALDAIVAADPRQERSPGIPDEVRPRPGAARTRRRLTVAGGTLAAITAAFVALPSVLAGDKAFASWTPAPSGMSADDRSDAAASCRRQHGSGAVAGTDYSADLRNAQPVIAERRGSWTTVILAGTNGFSALCITDDSARWFAKDMIGSVGRPTGYAPAAPRTLSATSLGTGTTKAGDLSLAAGEAGADVVAAVYRSATRGAVAVTVSGGHFAFWLPGNELENASRDGVDVEVTYRDGSRGTARLTL